MPQMNRETGVLRKDVRMIDIVTLGAGAAIGVAIFSIFAPATALAGPGMLISMAIAAIPMCVFAFVYAFMGTADPQSGASYVWPSRYIHPFAGFLIGWLRILASTGVMVLLATVLVQYWSRILALPLKPAMAAIFLVFYVLNVRGVAVATRAQTLMFLLMTLALGLLIVGGVRKLDLSHFLPVMPHGWGGVVAAVPLLVSLFLGIENAVEVGEETRDARNTVARAIAICVGTILIIYTGVSVATLGVLGSQALSMSDAPLLDAAGAVFGRPAQGLIILSATLAIAKSLNATLLIFSRYLFAMGREGALPRALARIHPQWGTPHVAVTVAFSCCLLGLLLPSNLVFLFLAANLPTLLKYLGTCTCVLRILEHRPDVYERAGFRPARTSLRILAWVGIVCAVSIVLAGVSADWRPYAVLLGWACAGVVIWSLMRRRPAVTADGPSPAQESAVSKIDR
jgi:APA family basic amino acid/polyamine antiporter